MSIYLIKRTPLAVLARLPTDSESNYTYKRKGSKVAGSISPTFSSLF